MGGDSHGAKQFSRAGKGGVLFLVAVFLCALLALLPLFGQLGRGNLSGLALVLAMVAVVLANLAYWLLIYKRWGHCIEVDEIGISSVTQSTRYTLPWSEIGEIRAHQLLPDGFLNISSVGGGASIRAYYALKRFQELVLEIAAHTQGQTGPELLNRNFGPERPFRPALLMLLSAFVLVVAGRSLGMGDHVVLKGICYGAAGLSTFLAVFRTLIATTRTAISRDEITVDKAWRSQSWALRDVENVQIGLMPGQVKLIDVRIQLAGGRRISALVQGADPVLLFNSLRTATGSVGAGMI